MAVQGGRLPREDHPRGPEAIRRSMTAAAPAEGGAPPFEEHLCRANTDRLGAGRHQPTGRFSGTLFHVAGLVI